MSEEMILCNLDQTDYDEILALWRRADLPVRLKGRDAPEAFARQLMRRTQRAIGLRVGSTLVAVVLLTHDGRKGWINRLAVDPAYRRRGLARALIAEAERWFLEELELEVFAALIEVNNTASLETFGRLGYQRPGVVYLSKRARPEA